MLTKRLVAVVSGGLLTAAVMTGCGESSDDAGGGGDSGSSGDDYCGLIEDVRGEFSSFESADASLDDMSTLSDRMGDIADAAPSEVSKEWGNMHSAIGDMVTGLEDAGVEGDAPLQEAVTKALKEDKSNAKAKAKELMASMSGLESVKTDVEKVQKNVKDECDIDLSEESK